MAAMGQLARSMAVRSQGRDAWNMSWGFHPTPGQQRFYANLLGAMNVRWCLHAWNDSMMFGPGYPHHPCWSSMAEDLSVHRAHVEQLEDWEPVVDTLLLYNWRAAAVVTGAVRHVHRRALILLAWTFTRRSVPFVFVDGDGLAKRLETEPRVRRVVLHWSEALPASAWRGLLDWVQKGGELTIIGPPPTMFSDASQIHSLAEDLAGVRFSQRKVPFGIGGQVRWQDVDFAVRPELLSPRLDDAPESTWLDSWPVRILEPVDARAVSWSDGAVIGTRCGRGEGTVTMATFEPSLVPGMIERIFGWNEDPVREVHFRYQRSAELKTVTIPWLDNP
jgi:hypothetical protein